MNIKLFFVTAFCLILFTGCAAQKTSGDYAANDSVEIYLKECVTAVTALLHTDKAKSNKVKTCESALLGVTHNNEVSNSKVMFENGELKSIEVWSGKQKRMYSPPRIISGGLRDGNNRCGAPDGVVRCCTLTPGKMSCCIDDYCCHWSGDGKGPKCDQISRLQ